MKVKHISGSRNMIGNPDEIEKTHPVPGYDAYWLRGERVGLTDDQKELVEIELAKRAHAETLEREAYGLFLNLTRKRDRALLAKGNKSDPAYQRLNALAILAHQRYLRRYRLRLRGLQFGNSETD